MESFSYLNMWLVLRVQMTGSLSAAGASFDMVGSMLHLPAGSEVESKLTGLEPGLSFFKSNVTTQISQSRPASSFPLCDLYYRLQVCDVMVAGGNSFEIAKRLPKNLFHYEV